MTGQTISRDEALALLREHKPVLAERFGVVDLALFGSTVRDEAGPDSDVDILVTFERPLGSKQYFGALHYLEDMLGRSVDLVIEGNVRAELRPHIEGEAVYPGTPQANARPRATLPMTERRWDIYVRDMIDCCTRITEDALDLDRDELFGTRLIKSAMLWNIMKLGDAANRVPEAVRRARSEIAWAKITGTRNRIVHGYDSIDEDAVWDIITHEVPVLIPQLRALLDEAEAG